MYFLFFVTSFFLYIMSDFVQVHKERDLVAGLVLL